MAEKRVQFNNLVQSQLPTYVRDEFPLIAEFLKQYYIAQEFQGAPVDLIQNIDRYVKIEELTNLTDSVILESDITESDTTISVDLVQSPTGTEGFPESYGLLKIGDEIITYTGKTSSSFTGCVRGFCGISSYKADGNPEQLVFSSTDADSHDAESTISNLSVLFLKEFLLKAKKQVLPGFENRPISSSVNQNLFIKQSKDFYSSKGTDRSFEILFQALYGEEVKVVKPSEFLFTPSDANYQKTKDFVVEVVTGDPMDLQDVTLFQDEYNDEYTRAYAPITSVEEIKSLEGETFYKLSIDGGYNRSLISDGSIYGEFKVHPKTKIIGSVSSGTTAIDVESTVGFPTTGELAVTFTDTTSGIISYRSKSLTQFYGCENITSNLADGASVGINTYAYGYSFSDQLTQIQVRINSVLNKLDYPQDAYGYNPGDTALIDTLGIKKSGFKFNNWFYNAAPSYQTESLSLVDSSDKTYRLNLKVNHYFKLGDKITITSTTGVTNDSNVIDILSDKSIIVKGQGDLSTSGTYTIKRTILRVKSNPFPNSIIYTANVQNLYADSEKVLVASPSIPSYNSQPLNTTDRSVTFSGTFSGTEFEISPTSDHGFYTGDAVYYTPEKNSQNYYDATGVLRQRTVVDSFLFSEGLYFVTRISDSKIKLSRSRQDIFNQRYVSVDSETTVTNNRIEPYTFRFKTLTSQKILREINTPNEDGVVHETTPGFTGVLVNGVEIKNYKSNEQVYFGKLNEIEVLSPGSGYDIINPPVLNISDAVGTGATGFIAVSGSLEKIQVLNPGFDYLETPVITITGGNGIGAVAAPNMKLIEHSVLFNSQSNAGEVGIGTSVSTIGFGTYHKFRNAERVIYNTFKQTGIGGLSTSSSYYVNVQDNTTVKLHKTQADAIAGINTITLSSFGIGQHSLQSFNKKSVLESVNVVSSGSGYQNKKRTAQTTGISTSLNQINILNHGYKSGEIINYTTQGTSIGGLVSGNDYYVTEIDSDNFKLSSVGVGTTTKDFYYRTNQYLDFTSAGVGTHFFNYPDIQVSVIGKVGISSVGTDTFQATLQPIFRGQIDSVHLMNQGVGYGSSEVINLDRQPFITITDGKDAQLQPIVSNGRITEVLVLNGGSQYVSPPNLVLDGDGRGAAFTPVLTNGSITSVIVVESGVGYSTSRTSISVKNSGSGYDFRADIQSWRLNLVEKHLNSFTDDDGFITNSVGDNYGLQYSHLYCPRRLRESVYSVDQDGNILYGSKDLIKVRGSEVSPSFHSPIIGWSYDGYPIYGPHGYLTKSGGAIAQMKSGYKIDLKENRPSTSYFPEGFFVEDYTHYEVEDESVLDENNGRFCVTPEYPNGTYAYFTTINSNTDSGGVFDKYRRPVFPYLVGQNFKAVPNKFNFDNDSNQDVVDLNKTSWVRNTDPYNLSLGEVRYDYLKLPDDLRQTIDIKKAAPGFVQSVGILTGGNNYKINDEVVFNNEGTEGFAAAARVSLIKGKPVSNISVATSSVSGLEIYPSTEDGKYILFSDVPHNFKNVDTIQVSGLSTTSSKIGGSYSVGVSTNNLTLVGVGTTSAGIGTDGATGIVTYFSVSGNLSYPNIRENDILGIGTETVKVLNVDRASSRIRVLRAYNGVAVAHTVGTILYEDPRKLTINAGFKTDYEYRLNKQLYFNPVDTIGLGTASGVGIGTTITFTSPGAGLTQIFIPTKSLYIRNHGLETGDELTYSPNGGDAITIMTDASVGVSTLSDGESVYVAKLSNNLIGLSTVRVGLGTTGTFVGIGSTLTGSTTFSFAGLGTGVYHSFTTNYSVITGSISRNLVTVSTAQTHGIQGSHKAVIDVNPSLASTITIAYNDYNRRLVTNPQSFISGDVNTTSNEITISNHGFKSGDKVIHTSSSPSTGLSDNGIYYVIRVDDNTFKLSSEYYNSIQLKPVAINITSASSGTISLVNPPVELYRDGTITFDLSDSSLSYNNQGTRYPAYQLNFYKDETFVSKYDKNYGDSNFNVTRSGRVGITTDAKVLLKINENSPKVLYYKLDPVYESNLPAVKGEINVDDSVLSHNRVIVRESLYNGTYNISVASTNTFTYTLPKYPERVSYASSQSSIITYETDCFHTYGPISKIEVQDGGKNYYALPGITTITSDIGSGAIIEAQSKNIGIIKKHKLSNIGYDFPADKTLRPSVNLPHVIKLDALSSFESIGITSFGRGYTSAPQLLVFDGKTDQLVSDLDLRYKIGETKVTILKNSYGFNPVTPRIVPTQNSNGTGIGTVSYSPSIKEVTVTLNVGFSTADDFPFAVNDKVLVENVSIGIGSTARGFDNANYNWRLFTLTSVTENRGGIGSVTYSLDGFLEGDEIPGKFDPVNSSGRIIAEKHFPIFNPILKTNDYINGEQIKSSDGKYGFVEYWDDKNQIVKIRSNDDFSVGEIIEGLTSNTQGVASSIRSYNSFLTLNSFSEVLKGWKTDRGFLNDSTQRIQDSYYYQKFSYSLNSRVDYDTWEDAVGSLNHTAGYKKFSDLQIVSTHPTRVAITTDVTPLEIVYDLVGIADLNCVYDFDLVTENFIDLGRAVSDEITFNSRIIQDYFESVGNRVLNIDDVSGQFNSNPRADRFVSVTKFNLSEHRSQKYITYVKDRRYTNQRQLLIVDLVHDDTFSYINQYGRVESSYDLGSFDFTISGTEGELLFYPTKYSVNDFDIAFVSYNLDDNILGVGTTGIGGIADIRTTSVSAVGLASTAIVSLGTTYRSAKILVSITSNDNEFEMDELNLVHDGTNVELLEYGQLTTNTPPSGTIGFGTYDTHISGSNIIVNFIPNPGVAATINTIQVAITSESPSGIGTIDLKHVRIEAKSTSITSSGSPTENVIGGYSDDLYDTAYFYVQISDTTNNRYQTSEVIVLDDGTSSLDTEYGILETAVGLGTIGSRVSAGGTIELVYTPLPSIDAEVKVYMNALRHQDDDKQEIDFNNGTIQSGFEEYFGTDRDIKRSFGLTHNNKPIFERYFDGSDSDIVDISANTITIPDHFYVTGENIKYSHAGIGSTMAIGIAATSTGIGVTDKLPPDLFVVKVNENQIKLAATAEKALRILPDVFDFTSVGIGTSHRFLATNQNARVLVSLDNNIQSPVVATSVTTTLADRVFTTDDVIKFTGISSFKGGDIVKIGEEIMRIDGIGIGSTNSIRVRREWMGTPIAGHSTGDTVTKVVGNYNIVDNTLNFIEAPYGRTPIGTSGNAPDERDWSGITTSSTFHGRSFMRSGETGSSNDAYYKNYIFDDISSGFTGVGITFTLQANGSDVTGIATENAIILINDIFQGPETNYDYTLSESAGITSIRFTGAATSVSYDPNTTTLPLGGVIVSVGSSEGFGYQPLVAAGGTAVVSVSGTIQSISIGNSGSGYRAGIQTVVNVGVALSDLGTPSIEFIGTAAVSNGNIVSVAITNPGTGYTTTNPPYVVFDSPLSYTNLPLVYSSSSPSGIGTGATIDIVVGQGSSVIDFNINKTGRGYGNGEILTIEYGGLTGIPTTSSYTDNEFKIEIDDIFNDEFTGWSVGVLEVLDNIEDLFNGTRRVFPLSLAGESISIQAAKGSKINVQDVMLIFINNILQVPGQGYEFNGGSQITLTEAPKEGDTAKVLFYKGSGGVDVVFRDIIETVKVGDELTIGYDPGRGQTSNLQEDARTVYKINSVENVDTNPYFGPGNTTDETLIRPVTWCKQTEDLIVNNKEVSKDRPLYEPRINPYAYIINNVGSATTIIYLDTIRPFFNPVNENNTSVSFQDNVTIVSQDNKVGALATCVVSTTGEITSVIINDGGSGYVSTPIVTFPTPVGLGSTQRATGTATVSAAGTISAITVSTGGTGYSSGNNDPKEVLIEPPVLISESNGVSIFSGDSGVIVGLGTTTASSIDKFIFDLHIPLNSYLRDPNIVGTAVTLSEISSGDYFIVYNSNVGVGSTRIESRDTSNNLIGIGTVFFDNVYQVDSVSDVSRHVTGVGNTIIRRIQTRSSGIGTLNFTSDSITFDSDVFTFDSLSATGSGYTGGITTSTYFGYYSWGKIVVSSRAETSTYNSYRNNGVTGLTTSAIVRRTEDLKSSDYIVY